MKRFTFILTLIPVFNVSAQSLEQGTQQMYYERYQSAENTFHQILQQDAGNTAAWYYLAKDYVLENKLDRAGDSIQLAPAGVKKDPWYKVACGTIALRQGKKEEADAFFNEALRETKEKDAGILTAVAEAQLHSKKRGRPICY